MKEMNYLHKRQKGKIVLDEGKYKGYEYIILNLSTHPCAYVCLTKDDIFYQKNYDDIPIECHGGLTFAENRIINVEEFSNKYNCLTLQKFNRDWILGWDYAHLGDYTTLMPSSYDKRWHTKEIKQEIKSVINQLIELNLKYKFEKEYIDWCDYNGEAYVTQTDYNKKDEDALWDFIICNVSVNGQTIEEMNDKLYEEYQEVFKRMEKEEMWDLVWEYLHPFDPFREYCDADFYGI